MTDGLPAAKFITAWDIPYPRCVNYGFHSDYEWCALLMFVYRVPYLLHVNHFSIVEENKAYELRMSF